MDTPDYVAADMFVMMRQTMYTYNLLFYINADERRDNDCYWDPAYSFVTAPLVRSMIDCLYNITLILQDPCTNGAAFRKSGFKKELNDLAEDERRYKGRPEWDEYIQKMAAALNTQMQQNGFSIEAVRAQQSWKTLGKHLSDKRSGGTLTPHQIFLKTFVHGNWRKYSAMAHGGFEGLLDVGKYYIRDAHPHALRPKLDEDFPWLMTLHIGRAALILLCIVTELQAYFRFPDANINQRIQNMWNALMPFFEAKELYDEHYAQLMMDKGIVS